VHVLSALREKAISAAMMSSCRELKKTSDSDFQYLTQAIIPKRYKRWHLRLVMPFELNLAYVPAGYSLNAARPGELCPIITQEFTSSEDGDLFINRLDGLPSELMGLIPFGERVPHSMVDSLLAIIRRDQTAVLYVNELPIKAGVRAKCPIQPGQAVGFDAIADIDSLNFVGVEIPPDCGVVILFSVGWRKGLYYDLGPLHGPTILYRSYDLWKLLGQQYAYLGFQHLFKITEDEWTELFSAQWFPFIALGQSTVKIMIANLRAGFDLNDLAERVEMEFGPALQNVLTAWKANPFFRPHMQAFETAVERHQAKDYLSSTSILFPRLEGLMRTYHLAVNNAVEPKSQSLVKTVTENGEFAGNTYSLFLPRKFQSYLKDVYFAGFDPRSPRDLSRNTISHGVAPIEKFTLKSSLIGLLILDQLFYYTRPHERASVVSDAAG
jgi:hypothetical protein